jgi:membrane protein YdbS with pleckstrin-like domain
VPFWHDGRVAISKNLLNEGETVVFDTRTHPKALILPFLALVVMLAVAVFLDKAIDNSTVSLIIWLLALAVILWLSVWPFLNWLVASYTVTNRRLITRYGVITRRGHDIPLTRVSDVAYEKDLIDRLLGCGTLVISDASTHGQVPLHDIPRVEERQRVLNDLLHKLHDGIPGNEGI